MSLINTLVWPLDPFPAGPAGPWFALGNGIQIVRQGASIDFIFANTERETAGWVCTISVKQYPSDTSLITRVIDADGSGFSWTGTLTSTETAALAAGTKPYYLAGVLTKAATDEEEQIIGRFVIAQSWAA